MLNHSYRLTAPGVFEDHEGEISFTKKDVLLMPTHLSICKADQRYYQGTRPDRILQEKLPISLIHEAAGRVVYDPKGDFKQGQKVVLIPNIPGKKGEGEENYAVDARFCGSSADGFLREYVTLPRDRIVSLPKQVPMEVGAFTEFLTIGYHSIRRIGIKDFSHKRVAVWGDGNLGYVTALLLKTLYECVTIHIFGLNREKLEYFSFADVIHRTDRKGIEMECITNEKNQNRAKSEDRFHAAFECVGGGSMDDLMAQIIRRMEPEGRIALLGVTELGVTFPTRVILEKGLMLIGNSRSSREDFLAVVKLYEENEHFLQNLWPLVGEVIPIQNTMELSQAFEKDLLRIWGKTILSF